MSEPDERGFVEGPTNPLPVIGDIGAPFAEPPAEPEPEPEPDEQPSVARTSGMMAIASLVSRITGFLRSAIIGAAIGAELVGDAYQVAYNIPMQVYELLLGGILTSVLVPVLVKARKRDADGGAAYTSALITLLMLALGVITLLGMAAAPLITALMSHDLTTPSTLALTTNLSYLIFPAIVFYGLAGLLAAVLNTRGHFARPVWAPIVNNIVVITVALIYVLLPGPAPLDPAKMTGLHLLVLGGGTTLGIACQVAYIWPALRQVGFRYRPTLRWRGLGLRELGGLAKWMFAYVAISQVGVTAILAVANHNSGRHGPGPLIHNQAFLLFMTVHGIAAVSVITALMPRMSAAAVDGQLRDVAGHLSQGTRMSSVVLVLATAGYLALGVPIAVTAFQWGNTNHDQAVAIGYATMAGAIGLVPFAISQMQIFAFYAMHDTRTPALINIPVAGTKVLVAVAVYVVLPKEWTIVGLQAANTLAYVVAAVVSAVLLRKRLGRLDGARIAQTLTRLLLAAVVAGGIAAALGFGLIRLLGDGKVGSFVALVVGGTALVAAYGAGAVFLRVGEAVDLSNTLRRRIPGLR